MYSYVVVDDEKTVRDGIVKLISSIKPEFNLLGQAGNGEEGIELIRDCKPDLVISDIKMPELDGIGMIRRLKEEGIAFEPVILSGYADFEFARSAIQLGVREYLLKPVDVEELRNLLGRIELSLAETRKGVPEQAFQALVRRLLAGNDRGAAAGIGVVQSLEKYSRITLLCANPLREEGQEDGEEAPLDLQEERELWSSRRNRFLDVGYSLMCEELGQVGERHTILPMHEKQLIVLLEQAEELPRTDPLELPQDSAGDCRWIVASAPFEAAAASESFAACHRLLRWSFFAELPPEITAELVAEIVPVALDYPQEVEKGIIRAMYHRDRAAAEEGIKGFWAACTGAPHNPDDIWQAYSYLLSTVLSRGKELNPDALRYLDQNALRSALSDSVSISELDYMLRRILGYLTRAQDNQYSLVVKKAMHFISQHFHEDLFLETAASTLGITPSYLSAVFSKETGQSFSAYLTNYRINAAKQMLLAGNLKIYEIAERVGYPDVKYFSRVFKKNTGMSASSFVSRSG